jgi:hypothetical protein
MLFIGISNAQHLHYYEIYFTILQTASDLPMKNYIIPAQNYIKQSTHHHSSNPPISITKALFNASNPQRNLLYEQINRSLEKRALKN